MFMATIIVTVAAAATTTAALTAKVTVGSLRVTKWCWVGLG